MYIEVTDKLRERIRLERKARKIRTDVLSSNLKKSTTFISNLENGKINKIDPSTLYKIFENIIQVDDEELFSQRIAEILEKEIEPNSIKLTPEEIEKETWMITFDYQYRQIPLENEFIEFIKSKLSLLNKTPKDLVDIINLNEGLDEEMNDLEYNKIFVEVTENGEVSWSVKFKLEDAFIDNILNKKIDSTNLATIVGILFNICKLEGKNDYDAHFVSDEQRKKFKFFTIEERNRKIEETLKKNKNGDKTAKIEDIITESEQKFNKLFKEVKRKLFLLRDKDSIYGAEILNSFSKNLNEEPSLTFATMNLDLYKLKKLDLDKKKEFYNEIKDILEKYSSEINDDLSFQLLE